MTRRPPWTVSQLIEAPKPSPSRQLRNLQALLVLLIVLSPFTAVGLYALVVVVTPKLTQLAQVWP